MENIEDLTRFQVAVRRLENIKELTRFQVVDENGMFAFEAIKQNNHPLILIKSHGRRSAFFSIDQAESIAKKLLQMVYAARREENNGKA